MTPKPNLPSRKKIRSCLRISIVALVLLYIFNIQRIAQLERMKMENIMGVVPSPSQKMPRTWSGSGGCASTLLYYYMSASLLWNAVLFWRKRHGRLVMLINITLVIISSVQSSGDGYCKMTMTEESSTIVARNDGTSWSDSYSPKQIMDNNIRISFRLHDPNDVPYPDKFAGVPGYRCDTDDQADLPPSLSGRTILNFTTTIATELKVVFIGDSISEQFAQAFDDAALGSGHEGNRLAQTYINGRGGINLHNCLSVAAPIRGGGVSAFWRIATLMSMSTRTIEPNVCEHKSKTWNERQALTLVDHQYSDHSNELDHRYFHPTTNEENIPLGVSSNNTLPYSVTAFDAIVLRLNHGWLTIEQLTKERIVEAINLSNKYLGAQTVIISTLPLNNNVVTPSHWQGIAKINQMVRDIATSWMPSQPGDVKWVLVQEFGNFTNQILRMNAQHIQLTNASTPDFSQKGWELSGTDFLLKRLSAATYWYPSTAMVCAERTYPTVNEKKEEVEDCLRNKISRDGCHWCVGTVGPRYSASVACLLGCVHNGNEPSANARGSEMVRRCERVCNERFMSILPVDRKWIGREMALFSKSV